MGGGKLDTGDGAQMMKQLLQDCGVTNVKEVCNQQATSDNVLAAIKEVGNQCNENDVFILYYTGHGDGLPDDDGDEADHKDEAMCLPGPQGNCDQSTFLRDDDLSE